MDRRCRLSMASAALIGRPFIPCQLKGRLWLCALQTPSAFRRLRSFIVLEYRNDLNEHNRGTVSIMSVSQGKCLYFRTQYLLTGFVFSLEVLKRSAFIKLLL